MDIVNLIALLIFVIFLHHFITNFFRIRKEMIQSRAESIHNVLVKKVVSLNGSITYILYDLKTAAFIGQLSAIHMVNEFLTKRFNGEPVIIMMSDIE